jgi:hypothetical protein
MDVGTTTGGEDVPTSFHGLLIESKAGIACTENHQRVLLK